MITVLAALNRKPGWSVDKFLCHYKERHAPLVAGTAGFTRHCRRYAQNHPAFGADPRPEPRLAREAISEMWFESEEEMSATYAAPDYFERARPDEHRFADFDSAVIYVCKGHEFIRQIYTGEPDKRWAHLPLTKLFVFHSASSASDTAVWQASRIHAEPGEVDANVAHLIRGHLFSRRVTALAADLPSPGQDTIAGVDEFRFLCISDALVFTNRFLERRRLYSASNVNYTVNISGVFLARPHVVFSSD